MDMYWGVCVTPFFTQIISMKKRRYLSQTKHFQVVALKAVLFNLAWDASLSLLLKLCFSKGNSPTRRKDPPLLSEVSAFINLFYLVVKD